MAEAPVQTPEIPPEGRERLGAAMSASVERAAYDLAEPATLWEIAQRLFAMHDEYGGRALELERDAERRPAWQWLVLVAGLYDREAVAKTKSQVIDGPLTLLGFTRFDSDFEALLRTTKVRRRLERLLGFPLAQVERPWARAAAPVELLPIWTFEHEKELTALAVDPRGRWLAAGATDGAVILYDLATGDPTRLAEPIGRPVLTIAFSPDGSVLMVGRLDTALERWNMRTLVPVEPLRARVGSLGVFQVSPDGSRLLASMDPGPLIVFDLDAGTSREHGGDGAPVTAARFSHDGARLATGDQDGLVRLSDAATGEDLLRIGGLGGWIHDCALTADDRYLAVIADVDGPLLWRLGTDPPRSVPLGPGWVSASACEFSPDGSLLAIAYPDGPVRVLDLGLGLDRMALGSGAQVCRFGCGGRLLVGAGGGGFQVHDVVTGEARLERREPSTGLSVASGLIAESRKGGVVQVWEEVAQSRLPAVVPDAVRDEDLVGVDVDAAALADVIAAAGTEPPLSIGLFGDWGSGKTFLIRRIQARVRRLAVRSRGATGASSYCRYIRNVEFNAWQYAEGNLWASLVTHLFDELAKPEPAAGVSDDELARRQVARLEAALAAQSGLRERLDRASAHADQAAATQALRRLTWGLAGADDNTTLGTIRESTKDVGSLVGLVLPHKKARLLAAAVALLVAVAVTAVLAAVGADELVQIAAPVVSAIGAVVGWIAVAARRVRDLIDRVGPGVRVLEVQRANLDAELAAARASEAQLQQELSDLAAGRRVARFAAARSESGDYRSQLGVVSRIHDDFEQMSRLLAQQRQRSDAAATDEEEQDALPRIDRIVLYIDDLDRCPPARVVEVLEAVHLILALPLFVVVLAVDPRWLLQSLRLHYSQLLAGEVADGAEAEDEVEWRSTPLNYVEKIIQVPFALRPMTGGGAQRLVHGLLPVHGRRASAAGAAATPSGTEATTGEATPEADRPHERTAAPARAATPAASLTPRTLGLTTDERDFAAEIAASLRTPRAIKKFTNLYRLLRARLDDYSGELDRFLDDEGPDVPEYEAVLILIAMVLAHPDDASDVLLELLDDAPPQWRELVDALPESELAAQLAAWTRITRHGKTSSCEPFRRHALEVSRYSFETGQQVFARTQNQLG